MPVATLDDSVIGTQGLSKPTPKQRAREPREPDKPKPKEVDPRQVSDDAPIRMPNPFDGEPVNSDPVEKQPEEVTVPEMDTKEMYQMMLSPEYREITKRILTESDEGKELLAEIGVNTEQAANIDNNQLSSWENECISLLRSSLNPYQDITELEVTVHLQVSLPVQPFSFVVKR